MQLVEVNGLKIFVAFRPYGGAFFETSCSYIAVPAFF